MSRAVKTAAFVALLLSIVGGISCAKLTVIDPGHVGVSVQRCRGGGGSGVKPEPIPAGYYWRDLFCESVIEYPVSLQTIVLARAPTEGSVNDDSITVNSSEGMPINVDVSLSFTLDGSKVPLIYTKYRNDLDHIKHTFIRQTIREALQATYARYSAEQLYSDKREVSRAEAQQYLIEKLATDGFVITQFTINETRVPDQVRAAINDKVAMIQDAQKTEQETRKIRALAEQKVAAAEGEAKARRAMADAEAYYNKTVASSVTPALIQYRQLEVQLDAVKKWNGTMPQMTGGALPFFNVGKQP
jgi:regulator of protease activity HflC (stomatin/prohibitin superfamily)